ncbi:MAG: signal recognition particle protein [Burkholderiales bacterium]|jgi:signal recognition particle subunit SRP54|nr:signal recognition particle protein [Pseudomonadota bacterium]MDA1011704.1 signal recognition particle protein [Pseudomonadota bacterium]|tara:strand:- start:10110 stop:11453 length:1344 start_codon:yes stop_codon:yes gene_type:complete
MLDTLTDRLSRVIKTVRGQARLTDANIKDALREVRIALLEADVALPIVKEFIEDVKVKAEGQEVLGSLTPGQALIGVVKDELTTLMGSHNAELSFASQPPAIILMAGLQGAGKTTTCGKLALKLSQEKKRVLMVSCDVRRPAAQAQLTVIAKQVGVDAYPPQVDKSAIDLATAALELAKKSFYDVLLVDTAGRLSIDQEMMNEIKLLSDTLNPVETLFVVDAMQGQDAVNVARTFADTLTLTGVILTKMDGDSRGGAALSVKKVTGQPIKFIGTSEKMTGLEPFFPDRIATRILGMGDILSLVDDAKRTVDDKETAKLARKLKSGKSFDLEDFKSQMQQMQNMGGMDAILEKLPSKFSQAAQGASLDEKVALRTIGIIDSMTVVERRRPEVLKASRKRRIAKGAGVTVQEVNKLLKQFEQMQKMMKLMGKAGGLKRMLSGMKGAMGG